MGLIVNVHSAGFELGWDTFVALGTIGLAIFTAVLAWQTRKLAGDTASDIAAQFRPILVPYSYPGQTPPVIYNDANRTLFVTFQNVGNGPALRAVAVAQPGGTSPEPWASAVIPVGQEPPIRLEFRGIPVSAGEPIVVTLSYSDVADTPLGTSIEARPGPAAAPNGGIAYRAASVEIQPPPGNRRSGQRAG
jgi:hypothetical protein